MRIPKLYREYILSRGIEWIALNDETGEFDPDVVADSISCVLLADMFNLEPINVANDVVAMRKANKRIDED